MARARELPPLCRIAAGAAQRSKPQEYMMDDSRGFFSKLFDTTFQDFITPSIARVVYVILIIAAALWSLLFLVNGLRSGNASGVVGGLVLAPICFLVGVLVSRIYMELVLVIFRIAENTKHLNRPAGSSSDVPPPPAF
jgi:hypothetical protein